MSDASETVRRIEELVTKRDEIRVFRSNLGRIPLSECFGYSREILEKINEDHQSVESEIDAMLKRLTKEIK